MTEPVDEVRTYRESPWPIPLHVTLWFFGVLFALLFFVWEDFGLRALAGAMVVLTLGGSAIDFLTRQRVAIGPGGIGVGDVALPWAWIEEHKFREVSPVRAGLLIRLTEEGRRKLGQSGHRKHHDERGRSYDLYLRANGDQLVEWFELVSLHWLEASRERLTASMAELKSLVSAQLDVRVVTRDPLTLSVHAASLDALSADAVAEAIPSEVRWDPAIAKVMLLLGPLTLSDDPGADVCATALCDELSETLAGDAEVTYVWAERGRPAS